MIGCCVDRSSLCEPFSVGCPFEGDAFLPFRFGDLLQWLFKVKAIGTRYILAVLIGARFRDGDLCRLLYDPDLRGEPLLYRVPVMLSWSLNCQLPEKSVFCVLTVAAVLNRARARMPILDNIVIRMVFIV